MAANPAVRESIDTFRELLKVRKSHRDVEPIQHVLTFRPNLGFFAQRRERVQSRI